MLICIWISAIALLTAFQEEVLAQTFPPYGGVPIPYVKNEDDDLGVLLAILLLAGRNKGNCGGCGCCSCCNCGGSQSMPVPFPIPFPTNNPIINKGVQSTDYDEVDDKSNKKPKKTCPPEQEEQTIFIDIVEDNDD